MKIKDLIKLLQQYDENTEIGVEAYNILESYDYECYIADEITIERYKGNLIIYPE